MQARTHTYICVHLHTSTMCVIHTLINRDTQQKQTGIHLCCYWNEMVNDMASFLSPCLVTGPVIKFEQLILMLAVGRWTRKIKMKRWQCRRSLSAPLSVSLGVASLWLDLSWSRCWEGPPTIFGQANSCAHCCQDEDDEDDDGDHHDHDGK